MAYPDDGSNLLFVVEQHQAKIQSFPERQGRPATSSSSSSSPTRSTGATRRACSAWPSTRSTRRTASSSSTTRPTEGPTGRRSVVSRFKVSKDDPRKADPKSEERIWVSAKDPFENHNGGCIEFGPDGYLYISLGDSGAADDPLTTGQNPSDWFGSILRIDVDHPVGRQALRHPQGQPQAPRPEVRRLGPRGLLHRPAERLEVHLRPQGRARSGPATSARTSGRWSTSSRTAATTAGASRRASTRSSPTRQKADPAVEDHARRSPSIPTAPTDDPSRKDDGKSITGGYVYRGKALPELDGVYVYGDFDTGRIWGLREKDGKAVVTAS